MGERSGVMKSWVETQVPDHTSQSKAEKKKNKVVNGRVGKGVQK